MERYINLDMDGVVADFSKYVGNLLGRTIGWEGRDLSDEEWKILAKVPNLYNKLPLIEESIVLVRLAQEQREFKVRFLTAIPRQTTIETAEKDKQDWLDRYFPGIPMNVGPYSKHKQNWCNPLDILVDDKKSNCQEWFAKGGISIRHTGDWPATYNNFRKALTATEPTLFGPIA